jgi:hypothetical protein
LTDCPRTDVEISLDLSSPRSPPQRERWEAHETLATTAWDEALNRYVLQVVLEPTAPEGGCSAEQAKEQISENHWATRQSSW